MHTPLPLALRMQPAVRFMFTAAMFIVFLVMLHNTAVIDSYQGDGTDPNDPTGGWPDPSATPPSDYPDDQGPTSITDSLVLFLFWIGTKVRQGCGGLWWALGRCKQ